jgi:hypothetical protein
MFQLQLYMENEMDRGTQWQKLSLEGFVNDWDFHWIREWYAIAGG